MASLRNFIKAEPVPHVLVVEFADDESKRVKLNDSRSRVRDAELCCKGAVRVEALDIDGNTLRVWEAPDAAQQDVEETVQQAASLGGVSPQDAMAMVTTVGRLLVEAADSAASRHTEVMQVAFQTQAQLVGMMSERLAQLERVWQETLIERREELDAQAEALEQQQAQGAAPSPNDAMVQSLLLGAASSLMSPPNTPAGGTGGGGTKPQ